MTPLLFLTKTSPVAATFGFFTNILTALTSFDDDDQPVVSKPNYQVGYDYPDPGYTGTLASFGPYPMNYKTPYNPYPISYKSSYTPYPINYKPPNYMYGQRFPGEISISERS